MTEHLIPFFTVWHRMAIVWRKLWLNFLCLRVAEPMILLYGLGFGLGRAFDTVDGIPYLEYVVPGIMCSTLLYASILEGMYGTLARQQYQRLWHSQLSTLVSLRIILLAEASWSGLKGGVGAYIVMMIGMAFGGVAHPLPALTCFPLLWLGGTVLASIGQAFAANATRYEDVDYVWALVITPMFIFSGTFIPVESFPNWLQAVSALFPLTYLIDLIRNDLLATATWGDILLNISVLVGFFAVSHIFAYHVFKRRLFS